MVQARHRGTRGTGPGHERLDLGIHEPAAPLRFVHRRDAELGEFRRVRADTPVHMVDDRGADELVVHQSRPPAAGRKRSKASAWVTLRSSNSPAMIAR